MIRHFHELGSGPEIQFSDGRVFSQMLDEVADLYADYKLTTNMHGVYIPSASDGLYTDTACTVVAAETESVAGMKDFSGNGRHAIQSTGALKPVVAVDSGLQSCHFTADILDAPMTAVPNDAGYHIVAAVHLITVSANRFFFSVQQASGTNDHPNNYYDGANLNSFTGGGGALQRPLYTATPTVIQLSHLVGGRQLTVNNSTASSTQNLATIDWATFRIGCNRTGGALMDVMKIYGLWIFDGTHSTASVSSFASTIRGNALFGNPT